MLSSEKFNEIKNRTQPEQIHSLEVILEDRTLLLAEVERLIKFVKNFSDQVTEKLDGLESQMISLESENERLRRVGNSSHVERDACVGLIAQLALKVGLPVGVGQCPMMEPDSNGQAIAQLENRVIVDLPSGQVSWDYLDHEAHLFEGLFPYTGVIETQTIQEIYVKVMNPQLDLSISQEFTETVKQLELPHI